MKIFKAILTTKTKVPKNSANAARTSCGTLQKHRRILALYYLLPIRSCLYLNANRWLKQSDSNNNLSKSPPQKATDLSSADNREEMWNNVQHDAIRRNVTICDTLKKLLRRKNKDTEFWLLRKTLLIVCEVVEWRQMRECAHQLSWDTWNFQLWRVPLSKEEKVFLEKKGTSEYVSNMTRMIFGNNIINRYSHEYCDAVRWILVTVMHRMSHSMNLAWLA
jgi:hypothetical protein